MGKRGIIRKVTAIFESKLHDTLENHREVLDWLSTSKHTQEVFFGIVSCAIEVLRSGNKLIFFGNGGSAAEATHLAGEFVGKCLRDVGAQPALSLADSGPILTAIANDWNFEEVFSRQVKAFAKKGDFLIALSTSGNSKNVIMGLEEGKALGLHTSLWTSNKFKGSLQQADFVLMINSTKTTTIQEFHLILGHLLCEFVEDFF